MFDDGMIRLILSSFALIIFSIPIRFIPSQRIRQLYSLIGGLLLEVYVFRSGMLVIYAQQIIAFVIIKWKSTQPKAKGLGALLTFQSMFLLSFYHIYEIIYNYGGWTMDASALLMILVCKYSLLAYAIQDGKTEESLLTEEQKINKVTEQITLIDFLGYTHFLPSSLIGPPLQFNDYKAFISLKDPYKSIETSALLKLVGKTFLQTFLLAGIYVVGNYFFPVQYMKNQHFYEQSAVSIVLYTIFSIFFLRFKYYFGWKLSMCSVHASGVSFSGKDFKKINTIDPWVVETNLHIRQKISHWNIGVQQWLRKCIYQRSPFKNKTYSQLYVFLVSAFWHGFYAGYYFSFVLWFLQVHLQGLIFKYSKKDTFLKRIYDKAGLAGYIFLSALGSAVFSHNACFFSLLEAKLCFKMLASVYCVPQILFFSAIVFFTFASSSKTPKKIDKTQKPE